MEENGEREGREFERRSRAVTMVSPEIKLMRMDSLKKSFIRRKGGRPGERSVVRYGKEGGKYRSLDTQTMQGEEESSLTPRSRAKLVKSKKFDISFSG